LNRVVKWRRDGVPIKSAKVRYGKVAEDLDPFLAELSGKLGGRYEFLPSRCRCGSTEFFLHADFDEQVVRRQCRTCGTRRWLCDSGHYARRAKLKRWSCLGCRRRLANVGVGFRLYEGLDAVHWVFVGARCLGCGRLECYLSWKIAAGPAAPFMKV
jgi:hypothetical protein